MNKPEKRFDKEDYDEDVHYMSKDLVARWATPDHSVEQIGELARIAFRASERYLDSAIRCGYKSYMRERYGRDDELFKDAPEPPAFGDDVGDDSEKLNDSIKKIVDEDKVEREDTEHDDSN